MMKKGTLSILAVILCMMIFISCSANVKHGNTEIAKSDDNAVVSIYVEDEDRFILEDLSVEIQSGETAFEILKKVTRDKKIHMEFEGTTQTAYVVGIDNIYNLDKGENSGWMFYVNGEMAESGPGVLEVKNGDKIEWIYVKDWTLKE